MAKIRRSDHPSTGYPQPAPAPASAVPAQPEDPAPREGGGHARRDRLYTLAMLVFAALFLVSAGMLLKRLWEDRQAEQAFADLASLIDTQAVSAQSAAVTGEEEPSNAAKFAALKEQNGDFVGWLSIEGTNLDFPVMQTAADRADFYLKHDFDGNYSDYGVPYLDENCTLSNTDASMNLVIYGHNMKTGTIFGCLTGYKQAAYYEEHPTIEFDNLYFSGCYEVFAAFAIDVVEDTSFVYNTYINMNPDTYDSFVEQAIARSDIKTGITPAYGEELLTLSTCEYSTENGRYVVVARRVYR